MRLLTCLFLLVFSVLCSQEPWIHLELGAGNYGANLHISPYKQSLEPPQQQYHILFWTLDELVDRYGSLGVFHINDINRDYANFAARKLRQYAAFKGYNAVTIEIVPGDYKTVDFTKHLSKYNRATYTSAHLKHPEMSFYRAGRDTPSLESRKETRNLLKRLASFSDTGLYLFIIYTRNFVPVEERQEFMERGIFYLETDEWEAIPYSLPGGQILSPKKGKVFLIQ